MNNINFDKETREKLASLPDEQLKSVVLQIAQAVNANPAKAKLLTSDMQRMKDMLSSMTDEQAKELLSKVDRATVEEVGTKLKNV